MRRSGRTAGCMSFAKLVLLAKLQLPIIKAAIVTLPLFQILSCLWRFPDQWLGGRSRNNVQHQVLLQCLHSCQVFFVCLFSRGFFNRQKWNRLKTKTTGGVNPAEWLSWWFNLEMGQCLVHFFLIPCLWSCSWLSSREVESHMMFISYLTDYHSYFKS